MKENLELWNRVEKTNPKYTKNANVRGNKITSISPQFQIMNVTEQFGIYGETWGFKTLNLDYSLAKDFGLVVLNAMFFFPKGEFEIKNSISLYTNNERTKIDNDFAKKLETDTLTKAISKLGFNADIFLGKFDDVRYVAEMEKEFNPPVVIDKVRLEAKLKSCETSEAVNALYQTFTANEKAEMKETAIKIGKELKEKLTLKTA